MNYAEVRKLVKLVESSKIQELELEEQDGSRIRVSKGYGDEVVVQAAPQAVQMQAPAAAPAVAAAAATAAPAAPAAPALDDKKYHEVKSPMVGTFYRAPAPDADPFATEGMTVSVGQPLCIVEAMKLMNEIESDVAGKIVSIEIENATPVEFGQVLIKIDTAG
jgi:acetyl-CoA carboxylase biotin carboxyl carrier protein